MAWPQPTTYQVALRLEPRRGRGGGSDRQLQLAVDLRNALGQVGRVVDVDAMTVAVLPSEETVQTLAQAANTRAVAEGALEPPYPWAAAGTRGGPSPRQADREGEHTRIMASDALSLVAAAVRQTAKRTRRWVMLAAEPSPPDAKKGDKPTRASKVPPTDNSAYELIIAPLHDDAAAAKGFAAATRPGLFVLPWRRTSNQSGRTPAEDGPAAFRGYLGFEAALYAEFMAHYSRLLLVPAVLSLVPYLLRVLAHTTALHPIYALLTAVWGAVFLRTWQRRQSAVARAHGLLCDATALDSVDVGGMKDYVVDEPREGFTGTPQRSEVTGHVELDYPSWRRKFVLRPLAWGGVALFLAPVLCLQIVSLNLQGYMNSPVTEHLRIDGVARYADPGAVFDPNGESYLYLIPVTIHVLAVMVLGMIFKPIAGRLTEFENHRTDDDHRLALIQKRVVFEFVDCYFVLFFVAFYVADMTQLRSEFTSIFAVDQLRRFTMETGIPWLLHAVKGHQSDNTTPKANMMSVGADVGADGALVSSVRARALDALGREEYDPFDDYLEMVVQFGYIAMFAAAFPPAAALSWLGNHLELRADTFKVFRLLRRPVPERTAACKPWTGVLEFFVFSAVVVNSLILGVTSAHQLDAYLPVDLAHSPKDKLLGGVALEHAMALLVAAIFWAIPAVPGATHRHVARLVHRRHKRATSD